jgi:hypothetical protein
MAEIIMKIGYTARGAYDAATTYDRLDVVSAGHGVYASKVADNVGHAVSDTAWWDVLISPTDIDKMISDGGAAAVSALVAAGVASNVATSVVEDIAAGKTAIATALTNQGSVTGSSESLSSMAAKVQNLKLAVPGEIRDFDRCGALGDIDLPVILKNNVRTDYPYSCGVSFFAVDLSTVTLSGADAYLCSDGFFCEGSAVHTFTDNPALYRYIIFYFRTIDYTVPLPVARVRQLIAWNGHPYFVTTAANKVQEIISYSPDNYTDNFGQLGGTVAYISVAGISVCATAGMVNGNSTILMMSLKALSSITGGYVVSTCTALATLALPALASITGGYVVYNCGALATLALPALASITGGYVADTCAALATLALPALSSITGGYVVSNCTALATLALPALSSITGGYVANKCGALATLALPALTSITGGYVVGTCGALATLALPALADIGTSDTPFNLQQNGLCGGLPSCTSIDLSGLKHIKVINFLAGNADRQIIRNTPKVTLLSLPSLQSATFITGMSIKSLALGGNKYENATDIIDVSASLVNTVLTSVTVGQGFAINLTLKGCDALTHDVLVAIIANLADQTADVPLTLKLDSVLIALLSAGEIAVATNKNWNVII